MKKIAQGVYKRGSTYWFRIQENGKRRAISLATDDETVAITRASLAKAHAPVPVAVEGHQTETFNDTINKYIASKENCPIPRIATGSIYVCASV
jgi:hypothetical protein